MADLLPDLLLPSDDLRTPEDDLDAAIAGALEDPATIESEEPPAIPLGMSWAFDWERGRFKRRGGSPAEVRGIDALVQWLEMARRVKRDAHDVFSPQFGMDGPEDWMGHVDVAEAASDYGAQLSEAWGVHDRVASVEDFTAHFEEDEETIFIDRLHVVTDTDQVAAMAGPAPLNPE